MKKHLAILGFVMSPMIAWSHETAPVDTPISVESEQKPVQTISVVEERYRNNPNHARQMIATSLNELNQALKHPHEFTYAKRKAVYQARNQVYKEMKNIVEAILVKYEQQPLLTKNLKASQHAWIDFVSTELKLNHPYMPYGGFEEEIKFFHHSFQEISKRIDTLLPFLLGTHPKYPIDRDVEAV